jgi:hypothetical protein
MRWQSNSGRKIPLFLIGVFLTITGSLAWGGSSGIRAPNQALLEARDLLMTRKSKVHWLLPDVERDLRNILESGSIEQFYQATPKMFAKEETILETNRFSEWSGDYIGFNDVIENRVLYGRILELLKIANDNKEWAMEPLFKLHLQNDLQQISDLLRSSVAKGGDNNQKAEPKEVMLSGIVPMLQKLRLNSLETGSLPKFDVGLFLRHFGYENANFIKEINFKYELLHEEVSEYRLLSHIFLITETNDSEIYNWIEKGKKPERDGQQAVFVLIEDMSVNTIDGRTSYTDVPKIVRTERVITSKGRVVPVGYGAYLLSDHATCSDLMFEKIPDEKGGVPLSDLPNAHNPYRTALSISCMQCHGENLRIEEDFPLSFFRTGQTRDGGPNLTLRQKIVNR